MKLAIGIVGLPNVGKSTLFKILTKQEVPIANYPFVTIHPNVGVVAAPDERIKKIAKVIGSKEILPAVLEFVDIAGLVAGAHEGRGLGNQFLAHIREVDAILHLIRVFKDKEIIHFEGEINPLRDLETVLNELKLKDEESKEKINLLSAKPQLIVLNGEEQEAEESLLNKIKFLNYPYVLINLKEDLPEENLKKIFEAFYKLLDLITFFTANENEARSWFVKKGTKAPQAAGVIHTDFEKKFIKAEVINWEKLLEAAALAGPGQGAWQRAKQKGWLRLEGKDYVVQEGDVMVIRHS
ncbi:redox-regulated ATPase YchF [Candidatus Jorgensenbacteria bacterium CG_4_10_14_0_8_um_filter_39_13]|uniref:Redox-regulated ATPase YchF n=2 Tax=Candidatus Joergenseniibacteriota TaxID=1752739 RepID=A0A2M7RFW0_9BACT|nr:MAG: redox-regulated ATPase YchF [Candidatus Jorgensenbacteria bacterium CG11_big_fil_rev_8_21_14_0_20_38_23]PIV13399.1 MAG: redox-regulated ATPase YchF [Candidatus Jorgensenbacteria bacterium CG03_land_8_20_14_0_80_38_39]PIW97625.1 MAG: redox-regulated ATPase YchF [Candidatus Jorgensenbacteria bacterium CG_4_8_14_3_um_filter_38_10]PIY95645.1 MAG: redox-regulated ATPase YchF [Candidatus Jorgensenbacteria bacterium CG_4_10_14_0_8_um_filter_39_13]PJA94752.1 MAG: redox-regulated ATPase YchF [Ca